MFNFLLKFFKKLFIRKNQIKTETDWRDSLLPSPVDFRDVNMKDLLGAVSREIVPTPAEYSIPYILTIKNQGQTSHCVGFVCATIKEFLERREGNFIEFSGDWIYKKAKEIDGIPNVQGTYFRAGLKVLKDFGAKPLEGNESDALKYRIGGYIQVDCDFQSLKRAIYEFGAILMGFIGSNQGWQTAMVRPIKTGESQWGHATTGIKYDIKFIDGQNSWGEQWGDKGLFHFLEDYLPFEAWAVVVDMPNLLLPDETAKPEYFFANNLSVGLAGEDVKALQDCLVFLGCMTAEQKNTGYGIFGSQTKSAVILFQKRYGIPATGFVGQLTRDKLNELFS